jgi:hypothetical protein
MLVTFERSGGFTGRRQTATLDTDDLPAADAAGLLHLIESLASAQQGAAEAATSEPRYRITIHRRPGDAVAVLTETQMPAALRPLLVDLFRPPKP